jgi:integrase/recombinase XerD
MASSDSGHDSGDGVVTAGAPSVDPRGTLEQAVADYLSLRRALGFRLERAERLLTQFLAWLAANDIEVITTEAVLTWAVLPGEADPRWWDHRLSTVRMFASYLHTLDPRVEVPPAGLIRCRPLRATPYLYSDTEITALLAVAATLHHPLRAATFRTLTGLLAVTGMRVGEVIGLDRGDFNPTSGTLTVRDAKFGKSRLIPLHATTTTAVSDFLRRRDELIQAPASAALLVSLRGTRLRYNDVWRTVHRLTEQAGLTTRSSSCRPRIHDLRHSFAVATVLDGYARGDDVQALLPRLATYLGHADPKHTYWYLSAAPELLTLAGNRLQTRRPLR